MIAIPAAVSRIHRFAFVAVSATLLSACQDSIAPTPTDVASFADSQTASLELVRDGRNPAPGCAPLCAAPRILFDRIWSGGRSIFRMNSDGSNVTLIASGREPAWSPDYKKIAFIKGGSRDVHVMNADGTNLVQLTFTGDQESSPTWSPDGTRIAFARTAGSNSEIYVMNANGAAQTRLTYHSADDITPAWSPDGARLAFVRNETLSGSIIVMNVDGTSPVALTEDNQFEWSPAWSPDGSKIAYSISTPGCSIATMNADGSNQTLLFQNLGAEPCGAPTYSASGAQLAFRRVSLATLKGSLHKVDLTSGIVTQLSNGQYSDFHPAWSRQ